ncbi:hypothetical protein [Methylosinus sp. Sm6]|uniref:hypothetical protein n=1 Tax=Methylosinus sp. Sm6 TaxID=2866948 RepID=UPI001C99A496|nr:hypothetical protein [Methylosinus sp. Sm6]MBY6241761.1 hypothetical protein [Methylosinus sp. Sm6]
MRSAILALILCIGAAGASAQSPESDAAPAPNAPALRKAPAQSAVAPRRCPPARRRAACARAKTSAAVVAPATAPMLPPLGGHVWLHEDPPLFDAYESAGPWYKPWTHAGTDVVQWRYGFPGGHVDWFRGIGWRPGFGWF